MINAAEKVDVCFQRLQRLEIKTTEANLELLLQTLYDLRAVYNELKKGDKDERQTDHTEG